MLSNTSITFFAVACLLLSTAQAEAGVNDFFGNSIPTVGSGGSGDTASSSPSSPSSGTATSSSNELAPQSPSTGGPVDYTADEKYMRKKYKLQLKHAEDLIAKGERMIKDGEGKKDDKMTKKGQIFKTIGTRRLEELKTNNPLPEASRGINALKAKDAADEAAGR